MHYFSKTGAESCLEKKPWIWEYIINSTELLFKWTSENFKIKLHYFQERLSLRYNTILKLLSLYNPEVTVSVSHMFLAK